MKTLITVCFLFLVFACGNSGKVEMPVINRINYLHDISPFTDDSLVNVVIEIPAGTNEKWEVNKVTGQIEWEQVAADSFRVINYLPYPANYGFVPRTLVPGISGGDNDPLDVFVLGSSIDREEIVKVMVVGMIQMLDDNELDSKLLAVNAEGLEFEVSTLEKLEEIYPGVIDIIKLWLLNYKGHGEVQILSVNDEKDAIRFLATAYEDYVEQETKK